MATLGSVGYGSAFKVGDSTGGASTVYTAVAEVKSIGGPGISGDDVEFASMDSADGFKEYKPGLVDAGEVELSLIYDNTQFNTVYGLIRVADKDYRIEYSDGATWDFQGYLKSLSIDSEAEGAIEASATFKISGKPTFTAS